MDPRVGKMGDVLVNYCIEAQPGQWIVIYTTVLGVPLAHACQRAILRAGAHPSAYFEAEEMGVSMLREANDEQIGFIPPNLPVTFQQADAQIGILAPANTRATSSIDPARLAARNKSAEPLMETMMRRTAEGSFRWVGAQYPTHAAAQDADMSLEEYADFVYRAGFLHEADPTACWARQKEDQQRLIDWLAGKKTVHITGPGTDLTVGIEGRIWENDDGRFNFPGGEIFTGPHEDVTEGVIEFTYPAYYSGREVTGVRLVFEGGRVVEASARAGEDFLQEILNMDEGARRLGEFAFGANYSIQRFSKNTLFDEKIGGTLHMALGRAYPETGGTNESALHWDMVYDMRGNGAEVTVDGQLFSKDGKFCV